MLRIIGRTSSINVRKVLWTALEIGLPFEQERADGTPAPPTTDPEFLKLNPNGQVPVIEDENGLLWESNTICRYLAGKHGRADLLPVEARARARVEVWMDWHSTEVNSVWGPAFLALVRKDPGFGEEAVRRSFETWTRRMAILEGQLAATDAYVAGPTFTLADIVTGLSVHRFRSTPGERPAFPAMDAYVARLGGREGFGLYATAKTP